MSAITHAEALGVVRGARATGEARRCVDALCTCGVLDTARLPTLSAVWSALDVELCPRTLGAFVCAVLRADVRALTAAVELVAPGVRMSDARAKRLHADCWLALSDWITAWNRSQIKRVA